MRRSGIANNSNILVEYLLAPFAKDALTKTRGRMKAPTLLDPNKLSLSTGLLLRATRDRRSETCVLAGAKE